MRKKVFLNVFYGDAVGRPYAKIYEVVGINSLGIIYVFGRYVSESLALHFLSEFEHNSRDLYKSVFVRSVILWLYS